MRLNMSKQAPYDVYGNILKGAFLYLENHSLDEWFKKGKASEAEIKLPLLQRECGSPTAQRVAKGGHSG